MVALIVVMKITKELKNATFEYDEETKKFLIIDSEGGGFVELNKVYAFAFMRFVVRMAQRNWLRVKKVNKAETLEVEDQEDANQINFLLTELKEK